MKDSFVIYIPRNIIIKMGLIKIKEIQDWFNKNPGIEKVAMEQIKKRLR